MLKIEDLSYRYLSRHKFTLKKINLQLAEGEMLQLQKAQKGDTDENDYLRIIYNKTASLGLRKAKPIYAELQGKADLCQACGACEHHCPQHICSTELMPKIAEVFAE